MATLKGLSRSKRSEALSKGIVVDTVRGVLRVRKWPRKRGTPKSASQRYWIDWFKQANKLAKYASAYDQQRAIEITKNSGMYPRDIILAAMRGRLYIWQDQYGKVWYPMAAIQDISESLDVLAQSIGSVLVRAVDRWRPAGPDVPVLGHVLTYQGPAAPPIWQQGGTGISQVELPGSPISPDNTVSIYDFDVTAYTDVNFLLHNVGFAASDVPAFRLSTDGGATYHAGASDYAYMLLTSTTQTAANSAQFGFAPSAGATAHHGFAQFTNLRAGHCMAICDGARGGSSVGHFAQHFDLDGPITNIRLFAFGANNLNAGEIHVVGKLSS